MDIKEEYKQHLTRDYITNPLKDKELPVYEDLKYLYIDCNLTYEEVAKYFNNVKRCRVSSWVKRMNLTKPLKLKARCIERIQLEKYGVKNYSCLPEFKVRLEQTSLKKYGVSNPNKCRAVREKIEKTNLERYGTKVASKSKKVKENTRKTCQEKYGVDAFTQSQQFKDKTKQTCLERYGVEYAAQSSRVKEGIRKTSLEKYGVDHHLKAKEVIEKRKKTCLSKWGTDNISTRHIDPKVLKLINTPEELLKYINTFEIKDYSYIAETLGISYEGLEKKLVDFNLWDALPHAISHGEFELKELFPDFIRTRQAIPPYEIDLYNEELKLGIEFNGIYWHCEKFKDELYHQEKSLKASCNGIFLYHIFEHEWLDERKKKIILSQLNNLMGKNSNKIGARKCIIKEINSDTSNFFLQDNHLQGKDNGSIRLGLFYNEELVSVMTFCKPRFNKNYEWELSRFCSKLNYSVIGGASKLFQYFLKKYNPKTIISYSNFSKTKGNIYSTLGFNQVRLSKPNYVWTRNLEVLSRYQCQKHLLSEFSHLGNT